jgi:threonine/homoserine/homoserine lactone efflux protein
MSPQALTAVLIFSLVMGFTPGPNNVMLASSGARFGIRASLPHISGVTIGFPIMVLLVGLGLASILFTSPRLQLAMKLVSCVYLLWLAVQIGKSTQMRDAASGRPLTFLQAALFQWVNPKAWLVAVGAISAYTTGSGMRLYLQVAIIALISAGVCLLSTLTWTTFGASIRRWLRAPAAFRLFNLIMALLLVASTVPIGVEIWRELRG